MNITLQGASDCWATDSRFPIPDSRFPTPDSQKKIGQVWLSPILDRIDFFNMSQEQL
ncbi:hypothetical protein BJP36_37870 [Moorena producens JHB]|uniref:Uncharacterized protein n=1 Tax=Moorena producens (strain JHB) TaxID=1454205 RepID=A0A9Q9SUG8_MOOP1|nr:hypothetical protein [Moorena producens]WAN69865.1 hypothetical protein BJP36_37870 [Moorena producens JHB]